MEKVNILGVKFDNINMNDVIKRIKGMVNESGFHQIATPNPEFVMRAQKDQEFREIINNSDLVTPDGIGIVIGAKIKGKRIEERVSGFDICTRLFEETNYSFYFLGTKEDIVNRAKENTNSKYGSIRVKGCHNGFFEDSSEEEAKIINEINSLDIDILLVALGSPRQEKWLNRNKDRLNCKVAIGVGGTFDVLAGEVKRAPEAFQKLGLEWLYRLIKQPSRIKRMLVLPVYVFKVIFGKGKEE